MWKDFLYLVPVSLSLEVVTLWDLENWQHWRLVVKLDPDKELPAKTLVALAEYMPDAVMVGGTQGITAEKTLAVVKAVRKAGYKGRVVQEVSHPGAVIGEVDAHFIPLVLNAGDRRWITGLHVEAIKKYKGVINWGKVVAEGYVICNPACAAGRLTSAITVDGESVAAYALLAEHLLGLPLLYLEFSGRYGDLNLVRIAGRQCIGTRIFYGGGVSNYQQAREMLQLADTVVIGNLCHNDPISLARILACWRNEDN